MSIKTVVCCDRCDNMIKDSKSTAINGLAVVGNIHVVNSKEVEGVGGGLVGNNLTGVGDTSQDDPTKWEIKGKYADNVLVKRVSYYCKPCFLKVLFGDQHITREKGALDQLYCGVLMS